MRKILLPCVFIFYSYFLFAQQTPDRIRFEHLTVADGLPENSVTCILQDHLGFMWMGTQNGLVRYDGTKMVSFQYNPDKPFSFMGKHVWKLLEDKNGDIWIGAENLFRFERATQRFIKYPDLDSSQESSSVILFINQDTYGCIWIIRGFSDKLILKRFDPNTKQWISYGNDPKNPHQLSGDGVYVTGTKIDLFKYGFAEDKNGKIWVNTYSEKENTLQWLDRKEDKFIPFHSSLSGKMEADFKQIGGIASNTKGELFLTSLTGKGFFILNTDNGQIKQFKHEAKDSNSLQCDSAITAYPDKYGFVWIPTFKGLDRYNPVNKVFDHYVSKPGDLSTPGNGILENPLETADGDIWFVGPTGMSYYKRKTNRFIRYESDETQQDVLWGAILCSWVDKTGLVWLGSFRHGLNKEARIIQFSLIKNVPGNLNSLLDPNVFSIFESPSQPGIIWFGTKKGLDKYDRITGGFTHYIHNEHKPYSITQGEVRSIAEDGKGRFWVGTSEGLNLMDRNKGSFIHFTKDSLTANSLSDNSIFMVKPVSDGKLWIGTANELNVFDYDNKLFTHYATGDSSYSSDLFKLISQPAVSDSIIAAIKHPTENVNLTVPFNLKEPTEILIAGMGEIRSDERYDWGWIENSAGEKIWDMNFGNTVNDGSNARVRLEVIKLNAGNYRLRYRSDDGYSYGHWNRPAPLHADLWGIQLRKMNANQIQVFNKEVVKRELNGPDDNKIFCITEDSKNNIWIGSNNGGLTKYDPATKKFISFADHLKGPSCISGAILENKKTESFWAGDYMFGLLLIDNHGRIIKRYNINGLPGNSFMGVQADAHGILWSGTENGLSRFDPKTEQFQLYNKSNGLQDLVFNRMAFCQTSGGEMYFGGTKGVNAFYPDQIKLDTLSPKTVLTDLDIAGRPATIDKDGQMPVHISIAKDIKLTYKQNDLTFHFTSLEFNRGSESSFAYKLSPNDKDWVQAGTIRQARYANLSPGSYTFTVKAANADGVWNETGTSVNFIISPPWWKTWWAYLIYATVFVGGVFGFITYRSATLKKENKVLEGKVDLRTGQLQTSLEDLKAAQSQLIQSEKMASLGELTAGIAHEIQNPLNFINNFSEVNKELIEEMKQELATGNVPEAIVVANNIQQNEDKINHHGKRADAIIKSMLQHARTSAGQREPTNINALSDEYLRLSYHGLRAKDKSFNATIQTNFDPGVGKINIVAQDIGRALLNLFNNAFFSVAEKNKQQGEGYEPTVSLTTKKLNDKVEIRIRDNGLGVPKRIIDKIYQPFFTTKPAGQGTGLGLSLSYDIVTKEHKGQMNLDTREGEYAEFVVELPVS
jgi:signal transduction histidine kinase/ligand-binding sensor domain-containing protein